jgi:hypothetical protein
MNTPVRELRREERRQADGAVRVRYANPRPVEIEGRLVDISKSGFRMAHNCVTLVSGQVVEFSHLEASGKARVMWNRVVEERVETGFLVVGARK